MNTVFPLDIASRASNLSEREQMVEKLSERGASVVHDAKLNALEAWKVNTLAGKLAGQSLKISLHERAPARYTREYLTGVLTTHKLFELKLHHLAEEEKNLLTEMHGAWLPTYQRSLQTFGLSPNEDMTAGWREPGIYYGKLAKVCEPFLVELWRELTAVCTAANTSLGQEIFGPQLIENLQNHLLGRFEMALAWAVETDTNVYCARKGIDKTHATEEDYIGYLNATFRDRAAYHRFYLKFPLLGRWLAHVTRLVGDMGRTLIERLRADLTEISGAFFGLEIVRIRSLKPGRSDFHAGGQSVVFVEVELANSQSSTFVYKPRSLRSEAALQGILARLAGDGVLNFATYPILVKEGYGYAALIPPGKNHATSSEEVGRIYEELGGYLGLFYILGGSDVHYENVLVANGHAFICDGETVLGVLPSGEDRSWDTLSDSVYKTGLLEWPRTSVGDALAEMKISGYAGGEAYELPIAQPRINDRLSFALSVRHETGIRVNEDAANRVYLHGELVQPADFKDRILNGFNRVHAWFQQRPAEAIECISELFQDASIRFVNWNTQIYAQMLISARHPKCLMEPLEADLIFNSLKEHTRKWDRHGLMAERECASLWQLDIPMFTVQARSRELVYDYRAALPVISEVTPLEYAAERIKRLSTENRLRQIQYITASLSSHEVHSPAFIASAMDYAQQVGWQLCELACTSDESAPWKSYEITSAGIGECEIGSDLYHGTAGIALFLAYLDALAPQQEFRHLAERALSHAIARCDRRAIGAFQGLSGLVYVLTHLYALWQDRKLLDLALGLVHEISSRVEQDKDFDVFNGVAGIIPVMLGLAQLTSGDGLDCAHRCAQHLLRHAEASGDGLSWPTTQPEDARANLTGFSHGTSGIGWALISLGRATNRPEYITAGRRAFTYETLYFDEDEQDWYDLRTNGVAANHNGHHFANAWCNGAAGIGLSRIASWAILGKNDDGLLKEAYQALAATLRNFHRLSNDTLCHGRAGNAELFLRFARLKDEPAFQVEANVQAQAQWRNFENARAWTFGGVADVFPGLMLGLAGLGLHFLRLAHPERVPSPLLLDPPQYFS